MPTAAENQKILAEREAAAIAARTRARGPSAQEEAVAPPAEPDVTAPIDPPAPATPVVSPEYFVKLTGPWYVDELDATLTDGGKLKIDRHGADIDSAEVEVIKQAAQSQGVTLQIGPK